MAVESAPFINGLNAGLPAAGDFLYEGDDHVRLTKAAIKATLPNITGAVNATQAELNLLVGMTTAPLTASSSGVWSLMSSITVSGSPSVIDFVHGSGGVDISSSCDQYQIVFTNLKSSGGTAGLRLQISENLGVTFPAHATGCHWEADNISSATSALSASINQPHVNALGNGTLAAANPACSGSILILRPLSGDLKSHLFAESISNTVSLNRVGAVITSTAAQFNAIRLTLSAGTFAGSDARVRFYGRRV